MKPIHALLGLPADAPADQLEHAYASKRAEYALDPAAPADLRAIAERRLAELEAAWAARDLAAADPAPARRLPGSRREWLWAAAGIALALAILGAVALLGRSPAPVTGLVAIDRPAPDVALRTLDGREIRLSDLRGKVVLVNFWATWCEPCKAETPDLVAAYRDLQAEGLEIIGVNLTDQEPGADEIRRFVQRYNVNYPVALDPDKIMQQAFVIYQIPVNFFIDPNGRVRYTRTDVVTRNDIERVLRELKP